MYKPRKLFTDRFSMIMSACASGVLSLSLAMLSYLFLSIDFTSVAFFTTTVGATIGILFGALANYQSLLSGFFHGVTGGIMGTMLGAVIKNPALCSLPGVYAKQIDQNVVSFGLFGTLLVIVTSGLLHFALRV